MAQTLAQRFSSWVFSDPGYQAFKKKRLNPYDPDAGEGGNLPYGMEASGELTNAPRNFEMDVARPLARKINSDNPNYALMAPLDFAVGDAYNAQTLEEKAMAMIPGMKGGGPVKRALTRARAKTAKNMAAVPNIRKMPVHEAVAIARKEPHLIPGGEGSASAYIGAPRNIQSRGDLQRMRNKVDANLAKDPRGGDWYDRYRAAVNEVTGRDPTEAEWMTAIQGQYSAGVDPGSELWFSIKDTVANLMGMPTKAARPAQAAASRLAIAEKNVKLHQLGKKTGEYAHKVNPAANALRPATGVNDFRQARNFGYTDAEGNPQKNAMTATEHTFMDYETALNVDRANRNKVGGRSDWTGEQVQAAPWVSQKAEDLFKQRNYLKDRLAQIRAREKADVKLPRAIMMGHNGGPQMGAMTEAEMLEEATALAKEDAFREANKTIADHLPRQTAYATHEQIPGIATGHLPGWQAASEAERAAYSRDPRSLWNNAPGGRDAIYSGLKIEGTGVAGRVRPSVDMQGVYTGEDGVLQLNPGQAARPLVGLNKTAEGGTELSPASREMLQGGEMLRAYIDAQDAGAAIKTVRGGAPAVSNSLSAGLNRKMTTDEIRKLIKIGNKRGLGSVVDTGEGAILTDFGGAPKMDSKQFRIAREEINRALPTASNVDRVQTDGVYADLVDKWKAGEGSGAATDALLEQLSKNPVMYKTYNDNPYIAGNAMARLERDAQKSGNWGKLREDLQTARRIIGNESGPAPGWLDRLKAARKAGVALPAIGALIAAAGAQSEGPSASEQRTY